MLVVSFFFPFLSFISILDVIRSLLIFHSCATVRLPLSQAHSTPVSPDWLFSNWWSARGRGCYGNLRGVLGKGETVVVGRGREGAPTQENGGQHSCEAWVVTSENGLCVCVWHPNYLSLAKAAECVSAQNVLVCVCIQMVGKESRSPLENLLRAPLLESFFSPPTPVPGYFLPNVSHSDPPLCPSVYWDGSEAEELQEGGHQENDCTSTLSWLNLEIALCSSLI